MMTSEDIIKELNGLVQLDFDASLTYEQALQSIDEEDPEVREDLEAFRQDHLQHIDDLQRLILELGGQPIEPSRDVKGVLLEGLTKLRGITGTVGALKAMRMNEKLTNRSYDKMAELGLPQEAVQVIAVNLADERRHLAVIEAHLARLTGDEVFEDDEDVAIHPDAAWRPDARV
jgi:rubrerythrin